MDATSVPQPVAQNAAMTGTDVATYTRERPGMTAFALEDGVVYHTYSTYARGLDGLWGMYQWLDRAPRGRNETGPSGGAVATSTTSAEPRRGCRGATAGREISRRMSSERASQHAFFGVSALLFTASAAVTIVWCASMSAMGEMPMPGGWTMSMAWMRMPGQTWPGAAASFLGMWVVMMVAMMLPSLVPMLWRYRQAVGGTGEMHLGRLTALVGMGYFFIWTVFGMAAFPLGVALAAVEMQQPALARVVPIAVGVVVLIAGSLQLTEWKARHLASCREAPGRGRTLPTDAGTAWRHGLRLGLHCSQCCAGLMAILLVIGVMDLRAMAVVTAAITVERLASAGERVARAIGAVVVGAGVFLIAHAAGLG
jgi:predicted metal-binding membrane protein